MKSGKMIQKQYPLKISHQKCSKGTGGGGRFFKFISKFARYIKLENDVNQKGGILWLE